MKEIRKTIAEIMYPEVFDLASNRMSQINSLTRERDKLSIRLSTCDAKKNGIQDKYDSLIESINQKNLLREFLNDSHNKAAIVYKGRSLPFSTQKIAFPVSCIVTPNDPFIVQDLKNWNMYQTDEDHETLVPKIYWKVKDMWYKYKFDKNAWGNVEVWEYAFEMRARGIKKGYDCDSWMILLASYMIASGIDPCFIRCVAGMSDLGGHGTLYVYSKHDDRFHHLNSTYGQSIRHKQVSHFPTHQDARDGKDRIGIKNVWFSFNNEYSWNDSEDQLPSGFYRG